MKFKTMTPIQAKAIPALLSGKDVLVRPSRFEEAE